MRFAVSVTSCSDVRSLCPAQAERFYKSKLMSRYNQWNPSELNNYLSFVRQYRNKHEASCPLFYGDFAVADGRFRILAARGTAFREGSVFALTNANRRFLSEKLTAERQVVLRQRGRIVLVSGELLSAGLYVLLLPHGDRAEIACAMSCLSETRDMALSAAVRKAAEGNFGDAALPDAEDETALLDGILRPEPEITAAELYGRIASYAGCHVRFDGLSASTALPSLRCERVRLTAYLLCLFLLLRKTDPDGAELVLDRDGGADRFLIRSALPVPDELATAPDAFLCHPPFAPFQLEWEERDGEGKESPRSEEAPL